MFPISLCQKDIYKYFGMDYFLPVEFDRRA